MPCPYGDPASHGVRSPLEDAFTDLEVTHHSYWTRVYARADYHETGQWVELGCYLYEGHCPGKASPTACGHSTLLGSHHFLLDLGLIQVPSISILARVFYFGEAISPWPLKTFAGLSSEIVFLYTPFAFREPPFTRMPYSWIAQRMGMAPGYRAHLRSQAPLGRFLQYGFCTQALTRTFTPADLNRILLTKTNHTGSDVRIATGDVLNPKAFPRQGVEASWSWCPVFSVRWKHRDHINPLGYPFVHGTPYSSSLRFECSSFSRNRFIRMHERHW